MKVSEFKTKRIYSEVSGVTAVVDNNIKIELDEFGIYKEIVLLDDNEEIDPLVKYISPSLNETTNETDIARKLYGSMDGIHYDKRIGYYKSLYAGHVSEGDFRAEASSGGMGTWILKELFEKKLIDGVIHVKKNIDKNNSILFKYEISKSVEEIKAGSKTKYYPVELSEVLKIVKETPGRYAIVGIPSFIMAVRLLSEEDEVFKERIKFTIGLICGHQKSSKFAELMAWQVGIKPGDLKYIDFRKKDLNRSANDYCVEVKGILDEEEVTIVKPTNELLGQNWGQGYFKVEASDYTDDVMNETADITLGDAWLPEYTRDSKGNNIVVVRNLTIDKLIKEGINSRKLKLDIVDKETIIRSQAAHYRHTQNELGYRLYKKDKYNKWRPSKRTKSSRNISLLRRKVQDLRNVISNQSHLVYQEAVELDNLDFFKQKMNKLSKQYNFLYRLINFQNKGVRGITKISKVFFKKKYTADCKIKLDK